jgi:hypothetical protein
MPSCYLTSLCFSPVVYGQINGSISKSAERIEITKMEIKDSVLKNNPMQIS